MKIKQLLTIVGLTAGMFMAFSSQAALIQGPGFIAASTDITPCPPALCLGYGIDINQIADGDVSNYNGFAGAEGELGIIRLDLLGNFDLESFTLWNDLNVNREGVETFRLDFFDASDNLIESTSTLLAPVGMSDPQTYIFTSTIQGVSAVDLEVLTTLTGGVASLIEIREVAFNGEVSAVPVPAAVWLFGSGLGLLGWMRRKATV